MTQPTISRLAAGTALLALSLLAACGDSSQRHAADGDTGAAAPATIRDMSATPNVGDSTTGLPPQAGTTDTTTRRVTNPTATP